MHTPLCLNPKYPKFNLARRDKLLSIPDNFITACLYTFSTWEEYSFHLLEDFGVTIKGQDYLLFEVVACHDAYLLLMKDRDNFVEDVYEIGLGKYYC